MSLQLGCLIGILSVAFLACHRKKEAAKSAPQLAAADQRAPAAVKPFSGPGFEWILAKGKTFKEKKLTLFEIQKTPSALPFDEVMYEINTNQFVGSSIKLKKNSPISQLQFEFEKQKVELSIKTVLEQSGEKILVLKIGDKTQDLLKFDAQKWTLTISWAGDFNKDHKLDLVMALGNLHNWMTVVASSADSAPEKPQFVSVESFQRDDPGHGN